MTARLFRNQNWRLPRSPRWLALGLTISLAAPGCASRNKDAVENLWAPEIGPEQQEAAFSAAAAVVDRLDDHSVPVDATTRERAFTIVRQRLHDPSPEVRRRAARTLVAAGYETQGESIDALHAAAADGDPWVRAYATAGLQFAIQRKLASPEMIAAQPGRLHSTVELVSSALDDPNDDTRSRASELVQYLGRAAEVAGPRLIVLIDDPNPAVASSALAALAEIGWAQRVPSERLVGLLAHPKGEIVTAAAEMLYKQGSAAVPRLIQALRSDPSSSIRDGAAGILGDLGATVAKAAIEDLRKAAAEDSSVWVRRSAEIALAKIEGRPFETQ